MSRKRPDPDVPRHDRPLAARIWYELIRVVSICVFTACGGFRATGRHNIPPAGGVLLISNHLSFLDVFALGVPIVRPLNYVARSTLFVPLLGPFISSVGGFPIQRDGLGASGLKEVLRRLRNGGIVTLFPEGTRSLDGHLGEMKPGIAVLAQKAKVPIVPAAIAGTFEGLPRGRLFPSPHPIRLVFGEPLYPEDLARMSTEAVTALLHDRVAACHAEALRRLARDLQTEPCDEPPKRPLGHSARFD